jgi:hypothetical protein
MSGGGENDPREAIWNLGIIVATAELPNNPPRLRIRKLDGSTMQGVQGAEFEVTWEMRPEDADADPPQTDPGIGVITTGSDGWWDSYLDGGFHSLLDNPLPRGIYAVVEVYPGPDLELVPGVVQQVTAPGGGATNSGNAPTYAAAWAVAEAVGAGEEEGMAVTMVFMNWPEPTTPPTFTPPPAMESVPLHWQSSPFAFGEVTDFSVKSSLACRVIGTINGLIKEHITS